MSPIKGGTVLLGQRLVFLVRSTTCLYVRGTFVKIYNFRTTHFFSQNSC